MTIKSESLGSGLFVQPVFVKLSKEGTVSVQMRSTNSEELCRKLENKVGRKSLSLSARIAAKKLMNNTARCNDFQARWSPYKMSREKLERKVSEKDIIVGAMTASMKPLEKKVSWL